MREEQARDFHSRRAPRGRPPENKALVARLCTGHGTQKPVELMRRPILNHTERGDRVYDPFLGSGTTLIAAEQTERACYGLEIDPRYVDVIVRRWQEFSGKKAEPERRLARYSIDPTRATMQHAGDARSFMPEESERLHEQLDALAHYIMSSTLWWHGDNGKAVVVPPQVMSGTPELDADKVHGFRPTDTTGNKN